MNAVAAGGDRPSCCGGRSGRIVTPCSSSTPLVVRFGLPIALAGSPCGAAADGHSRGKLGWQYRWPHPHLRHRWKMGPARWIVALLLAEHSFDAGRRGPPPKLSRLSARHYIGYSIRSGRIARVRSDRQSTWRRRHWPLREAGGQSDSCRVPRRCAIESLISAAAGFGVPLPRSVIRGIGGSFPMS